MNLDLRSLSRDPRAVRWLAMAAAFLLVSGISSIGQVNSRDDVVAVAGGVTTPSDDDDLAPGVPRGSSATSTTVAGSDSDPGAGGDGTGGDGGPGGAGSSTTVVTSPPPAPTTDFGLRTQGVTDAAVKLGISYNVSGCGDSGALQAMLGAAAVGDAEKAIDAFTRHINDTGGIGGRELQVVVADDGGGGCPEKASAAARKLAEDDKVFMVIPGLHEVSDYTISKGVPTMIGRDDPASLARIGPNGIGLTQEIGGVLKAWTAFGRWYLDSKNHKPCLVRPETGVSGDWDLYETILLDEMRKLDLAFVDKVVYKDDVSTAQQQSLAAANRLKASGCDQVYFMAINAIAPIFFTKAATQTQWYPQWTFTSYMALADTELGGSLQDQTQWDNAVGLSTRVPDGEHPFEDNCKRIYERYYGNDGQSESASVVVVCAGFLSAAEMMRRGEALTGRLDANSVLVGADSIDGDFFYDAHVPLDWRFPAPPGPYKTKGWSHYTVVDWDSSQGRYLFPEYPIYWEVMGQGKSNGVDLRPYWADSAPPS